MRSAVCDVFADSHTSSASRHPGVWGGGAKGVARWQAKQCRWLHVCVGLRTGMRVGRTKEAVGTFTKPGHAIAFRM